MNDLAFDREGHLIVCHASADGSSIQDATTGKMLWQSNTQRKPSDIRLSADARRAIVTAELASFAFGNRTPPRLIDVAQGKVVAELKHPGLYPASFAEFSADGSEAILLCSNALSLLNDDNSLGDVGPGAKTAKGKADAASLVRWSLDQPEHFSTDTTSARTIFSHDGKWLVSGTIGGLRVRDRASGSEHFHIELADTLITQLTLSPDDATLVIGDGRTALQMLDLAKLRRELRELGLDW